MLNSEIAHAHMKLGEPEGRTKAWHMMQLLEAVSICTIQM